MGFMKNFSTLFKPDDEYVDDEEYEEEEYEEESPVKEQTKAAAAPRASGGVSSTASLEMKIIKPDSVKDQYANHIAEILSGGKADG